MFFCLFLFIFGLLVKGLFFSSLDWWLVHLKKNLNKCYSKFNSKNTYTSVYFIFIKIIIFSPVSPWRWTPWPWCLTSGPTALPFSCASWSPSAVSQPLLCAWCQLSARVLGPISSLSRFPVLFSSMLVTIWAGRNSILMTLYFKHTLTQWPNILWYSANHWALTSNKGILVTIRNYHCFFFNLRYFTFYNFRQAAGWVQWPKPGKRESVLTLAMSLLRYGNIFFVYSAKILGLSGYCCFLN